MTTFIHTPTATGVPSNGTVPQGPRSASAVIDPALSVERVPLVTKEPERVTVQRSS